MIAARSHISLLAFSLLVACGGAGSSAGIDSRPGSTSAGASSTGGTGGAPISGGMTARAGSSSGEVSDAAGGVVSVGGNSSSSASQTTAGSSNTGGTRTQASGGSSTALVGGASTFSTGGSAPKSSSSLGGTATGGRTGTGGVSPTTGGAFLGGASAVGGSSASGGANTGGTSANGGSSAITGPCDIYQAGSTPCVAAHSTVRALYGAYSGKLYQLRRADKTTKDILTLSPGGYADSATQETFCANTTCTISIIYDQSSQQNHLTLTSGGWIGTRAKEANAFGVKTTLNGHTVYGIHVPLSTDRVTGVGYRNNSAKGTAKGDEPESMYMVANGKLYSNECCFDYGNAETTSLNDGNATMEAIYFGNCTAWGVGEGNGPWVMADLENGLFSGKNAKLNAADKSINSAFFTAMLKGKPHTFALKAGDSQQGTLTTMYEGAYPSGGYDPMKKEGAIVLGTGGDNSFMGAGDFFEGAMTAGYSSDATDTAIQANIVAAGYGK